MTVNVDAVLGAALALPPQDRAIVAERLLESLNEGNQAEIDAAWLAEVERRLEAFDRGEMKAVPAEEVMRSLRIRKKP